MLWILIAIVAIIIIYVYLIRPHKYWTERGVKQTKPIFIFGDNFGTTFQRQSFPEMIEMGYNAAPNSRYSGMYQFLQPALVLRDPDLIKQMTVKDFDHFVNHPTYVPEDCDPLWDKNLLSLSNQKWRDMRTILSPAFTGSKMKYMFSLMLESGDQFVQYFLKQDRQIITLEMKDTFTRFTNDVIANTAFGMKCDSLEERNNEFYLMGREATDFRGLKKTLKFIGYFLIPSIYKFFNVTLFDKHVGNFFRRVVSENVASREKHGVMRPDMITLLMEARKNKTVEEPESVNGPTTDSKITNEDITAQVLLFFFGGFDSVASLMCFMSYELALNPDVQQKLMQEVDETSRICKGQLTYDGLVEMKYMDMVVSETLRLWPTTVLSDRVCTKPYTIKPQTPDEKPLHLEKGATIWIPQYSLHRDPRYFPEPNRFDPERFSDENKANIRPYTYIPFGCGPRNCIGSRFALLETKTLFFYILSHFEIVPVEKTEIPLQIDRKSFTMTAENGFWLGLKRRNEATVQ